MPSSKARSIAWEIIDYARDFSYVQVIRGNTKWNLYKYQHNNTLDITNTFFEIICNNHRNQLFIIKAHIYGNFIIKEHLLYDQAKIFLSNILEDFEEP
jgi:hypothetical protein